MKHHFTKTVLLASVCVFANGAKCLADQGDIMLAVEQALSNPDISVCWDDTRPLFEKASIKGYFADTQKSNALLSMVADRVLDKRIIFEDKVTKWYFADMEEFMKRIVNCDAIAETNVYLLKLSDYLADENMISTPDWWERVNLAREKDEALIAEGRIQRPPIITGSPNTPNLSALRQEYRRIRDYNRSLFWHRLHVADIFAERMGQYLRSLGEEEADAFCKLFSNRAGLSAEEEVRFFPEGVRKNQRTQAAEQDRGGQRGEFFDIDLSASPFDFLRRRPDNVDDSDQYSADKGEDRKNEALGENECYHADQGDIMDAFKRALSNPDIVICQIDCEPLFKKAEKERLLANTNVCNTLLLQTADRVLGNRISQEDSVAWERFKSIEYFMKRIVNCDAIAETNVYLLKLSDYLADEKTIPTPNKEEELELAKKKDQALADSGVVERLPVIVGRYVPPNMRAWQRKYCPIENWNILVGEHRQHVAGIFSERMAQYLRSLKKEDAEAFRRLFTERAGLSKEEENLFFPKGKDE